MPLSIEQLSQIIQATNQNRLLGSSTVFSKIRIDSRTVEPGDVFWAIVGKNHDGHDYIEEAFARGAVACVVHQGVASNFSKSSEAKRIEVSETLTALQQYAKWHREQHSLLSIGITGSVGKTTTREMLRCVLSVKKTVVTNPQNYNNEIGVPQTLLNLDEQSEVLITEMGATKPGDIQLLCELAQPTIGVITGIGPAHLESFGSLENTAVAKKELFNALPSNGQAYLNLDSDFADELARDLPCEVNTYGQSPSANATYTIQNDQPTGTIITVENEGYQIPHIGTQFIQAAIPAILIAKELNYSQQDIQQGLNNFTPLPGRCRIVQTEPYTVIDDTYNASPQAVNAAIHLLAKWKSLGKRILALGDMLQLGNESQNAHIQAGRDAAKLGIDVVYSCGQFSGSVKAGVDQANTHCISEAFDNHSSLIQRLQSTIDFGDVLLVKGSRQMRMETVIEGLQSETASIT